MIVAGEKTVASAGTAEALATTNRVKSLTIIAKAGNTGQVYVGGSDVSSATNDGLDAGENISFNAASWLDIADIFIDTGVSGEGVDFYAVKV